MGNIAGLIASPAQQESLTRLLPDDGIGDQSQEIERMEEGAVVALTFLGRFKRRFLGYLVTMLGYMQTSLRMVSAFLASVYVVAIVGVLQTATHWVSVFIGWTGIPVRFLNAIFWPTVSESLSLNNTSAELGSIRTSCMHLEGQKDVAERKFKSLQNRYDCLLQHCVTKGDCWRRLLSEYYSLEKRYLAQVDRLFAFEQQSLRYGSQIEDLRNKNEALLDRIGQEVSRRGRTGNLVMERDSLIRELKLELFKREEERRNLENAQKKVDEQRPAMDTNKSDLASQMRKLVKAKTKLEKELVSAKKDVDWYETQSIQQQDLIRRVRRDLGVAQDLERVLRKENSVLQRKNSILQEENTILLEENATIRGDMQRLGDAVQRTQEDYREDLETIKTYYKEKLAAAQVAHDAVVASYRQEQEDLAEDARKRHQQYKESLALTTQRFMEEDRPLLEAAAVMAARDKWKGEIEQLCAQRDAEWENDFQTTQAALLQERTHLQSLIEDLRRKRNEDQRSFDKRVEKEVVKRLAGQRPAASIEPRVIAELEQRVHDLEIQIETERQEHQDRLTAAVQEGWMMGDEKVAAVLEDRDQIEADYLKVCEERDRLVQEQGEYREYCAIYLDKFEECQVKLVDLQRANDKVLAAQDATLAVNNEHKRNLERANEQVETLVDQVFELEEELKVMKAAQEEAKKVVRPSVYQRDTRGDGGIKRPRASTAKLPVQRQEGATGQVSKGAERQEKPGAPLKTEPYRLPECHTPPIPGLAHPISPSPLRRETSRTMGRAHVTHKVSTTTTAQQPARLPLQSATNRVNVTTAQRHSVTKATETLTLQASRVLAC